jgi:PAS domain S-box-containing protein
MPSILDTLRSYRQPNVLRFLTFAVLAGTFLLDLFTHRGIAAWALYPVAILTAMKWQGRPAIISTTLTAIGLTILGGFWSEAGHAEIDFVNRVLGVTVLGLVGMVCLWLERQEEAYEAVLASQRRQELTLRSVVQAAADAIILADGQGNIVSWNKAATSIFGHKEKETLGRPLTMLIPERYRAAHLQGLERVRSGGEPHVIGKTVELRGLRKDGEEFPIELSLASWEVKGDVVYSGIIRDITLRKREESQLAAQYAVTRSLAESGSLEEASATILKAVCETVGWEIGAFWVVDGENKVLQCIDVWQAQPDRMAEFVAATKATAFTPGVGLPGRVWSSGAPAWITDVVQDGNFPRIGMARSAGLHAAFAFPVLSGDEVTGVIEFFSRWVRRPDQDLLLMMSAMGGQIGLFLSRRRAEAERERLLTELQHALANIKTLHGLLPICASCKKVRDDSGYWNRIEDYVRDRSQAEFTHGICPDCARKMHPDWDEA